MLWCSVQARAQDRGGGRAAPPQPSASENKGAAETSTVADEPRPEEVAANKDDLRQPWPVASAVVAGPLVHGAGHLVGGEDRTGLRLLLAEGVGLAAVGLGIGGMAITGASEKTLLPLIAATGLGAGLFVTSFLADLYGVVAPPGGFGQALLRPALVAEAGVVRVDDPLFAYDALAYLAGRAYFGMHAVSLQVHMGMDHSNQRLRGTYGYRFLEWDASTYLEARLGALYHRYAPEGFSMAFAEGTVGGRLGLHHIGPSLQGAFVEGDFGVGLGAHRYFGVTTESDSLLLMRLGFGVFIGDGGSLLLYYDHRHDDYAAGMKMPGLGSGVIGHVGAVLEHYFAAPFGVALRGETGSAALLGLSLLYRRTQW